MGRPNGREPVPAAFVDTAAWVGLVDRNDSLHEPAKQVLATLQRDGSLLVTTELVLIEVGNSLATPPLRSRVVEFIAGLRDNRLVRIIPADPPRLLAAWRLFAGRPDKSWSLTDCFSFLVMAEQAIHVAFTSDHHFEQAGYIRLMSHDG